MEINDEVPLNQNYVDVNIIAEGYSRKLMPEVAGDEAIQMDCGEKGPPSLLSLS